MAKKELKIATLNVGSLTGRTSEIVELMERKKIKIIGLQETKWKGNKARELGMGYKLFYAGMDNNRNGVGIMVNEDLKREVTEVERTEDRIIRIKIALTSKQWHFVSCYAPQVGCEEDEKVKFWENMDRIMQNIPSEDEVIILGDLNGHVGRDGCVWREAHGGHGFGMENNEGIRILEFAVAFNMSIVNTQFFKRRNHLITYRSGNHETQIDYIMIRKRARRMTTDCKTLPYESITAQHRVVVAKLQIGQKRTKRPQKRPGKIKWWKLKTEEVKAEFVKKAIEGLRSQKDWEPEEVEETWERVSDLLRKAGEEVCGRSKGKRKEGKETWWWNEETEKTVKKKKEWLKKWKESGNEVDKQMYKKVKVETKRVIAEQKEMAVEELYRDLETKEGQNNIFRIAASRNKKNMDVTNVKTVKDVTGKVLTENEEITARWTDYFSKLLNEENPREQTEPSLPTFGPVSLVSREEVEIALKGMKINKAAGTDELPVEVWKTLGVMGIDMLVKIFNAVLIVGKMPEHWRHSILIPIYKEKGDIQDCKNYRGIKLLQHTFKLWERVIDGRLRKIINIAEDQFGFVPGKGTTDAVFALRLLMEKYREGRSNLNMVFIDLEKAYDRVPREEIWRSLRMRNVPEAYVRVIQDMYSESTTSIRSEAGMGNKFKVKVGLHQGSALSPLLFITLLDVISEKVKMVPPFGMLFADDIVLCNNTMEGLTKHLDDWCEALEKRGLKVSRQKTQYMKCKNGIIEDDEVGQLRLGTEVLEQVKEFKYLGSVVQEDGEMKNEISNRIQSGWRNWRKCSGVLCDRKMPEKLKGKIYKMVIRPAMLYAAETWATKEREEKRLAVQEMRMLRWMNGLTRRDKVENKYVRGEMKVANIRNRIIESRLRWAGHVWRREQTELSRRMLEMEVSGRRRGRPKTRWKDSVMRDMRNIGAEQEEAINRVVWRRVVHHHCGDPKG